ncbi:MAG: SBBP repeat-containing protein [Blastocatellia bacterium]|nr:SBBP repeat-containing protein [Blastocatellia bacterium]
MILARVERFAIALFFVMMTALCTFLMSSPVMAQGYSVVMTSEGADEARAVTIGGSAAWVVGRTSLTSLTNVANPQTALAGGKDGFISKVNSSGVVVWSTYLGGSGNDTINAVAYSNGYVYVAGTTASTDFPTTVAPSPWPSGKNSFVSVINVSTGTLTYSTVFGGDYDDGSYGIALASDGRICVVGEKGTSSGTVGLFTVFPAVGGSSAVRSTELTGSAYAIVRNSEGDMIVTGKSGVVNGYYSLVIVGDTQTDPSTYMTYSMDFIGYALALSSTDILWIGGAKLALDNARPQFGPREGDEGAAVILGSPIGRGGSNLKWDHAITIQPKVATTITLPYAVRSISLNPNGGAWVSGPNNSSGGFVKRINADYTVTDLTGVSAQGRGMVKLNNGFVVVGSNNSGTSNSFAEYRP